MDKVKRELKYMNKIKKNNDKLSKIKICGTEQNKKILQIL